MRIAVTGGLGLIGHKVVNLLEQQDHQIIIVDTKTTYGIIPQQELDYLLHQRRLLIKTELVYGIDIADIQGIDWLFAKHKPQLVIHLASFPRQKLVNVNPCLGSRTMSEGLLNLLEASRKHTVDRFFYASSSMVYGNFTDYITEDAVCSPQGQYGIMKLAGEWLVRDYVKHGIDHTIFRPSAVYGPLDVEDRVISKFLLTAMRGGVLKVNGVNETLDFTFVDDAARGIVSAVQCDAARNNTYNITKSHSKTLLAAAELAVRLAGAGTIELRDKDSDFPSRGALDITAARKDFAFDPLVDIEEGFARYHHWLTNSSYWKNNLA